MVDNTYGTNVILEFFLSATINGPASEGVQATEISLNSMGAPLAIASSSDNELKNTQADMLSTNFSIFYKQIILPDDVIDFNIDVFQVGPTSGDGLVIGEGDNVNNFMWGYKVYATELQSLTVPVEC